MNKPQQPFDFANADHGDYLLATFQPARTDDLKPSSIPIGWRGPFQYFYHEDRGPYAGQTMWKPATDCLLIPACDLVDVEPTTTDAWHDAYQQYQEEEQAKAIPQWGRHGYIGQHANSSLLLYFPQLDTNLLYGAEFTPTIPAEAVGHFAPPTAPLGIGEPALAPSERTAVGDSLSCISQPEPIDFERQREEFNRRLNSARLYYPFTDVSA